MHARIRLAVTALVVAGALAGVSASYAGSTSASVKTRKTHVASTHVMGAAHRAGSAKQSGNCPNM